MYYLESKNKQKKSCTLFMGVLNWPSVYDMMKSFNSLPEHREHYASSSILDVSFFSETSHRSGMSKIWEIVQKVLKMIKTKTNVNWITEELSPRLISIILFLQPCDEVNRVALWVVSDVCYPKCYWENVSFLSNTEKLSWFSTFGLGPSKASTQQQFTRQFIMSSTFVYNWMTVKGTLHFFV